MSAAESSPQPPDPMSKTQPLISITLPNYNYGAFLAESIEGVLNQTYPHWELLITDDGSTDGSQEIIEAYAKQDTRIHPVYFEQNQGTQAAHGNTWRRVSGELVYQYSSDDAITEPTFFARAVHAMQRHPDCGGFFGAAAMVGTETGEFQGYMGRATAGYSNRMKFLAGFLRFGFFIPGISAIWRKDAIDHVGAYDPALGPQTDYFVNHAIASKFGVVFEAKAFAKARISESQASYSSNTNLQAELDRFALVEEKMKRVLSDVKVPESDWANWRSTKHAELSARHAA